MIYCAAQLSNRFAPEHLELAVKDADELLEQITHAGAIFWGPVAPNHWVITVRALIMFCRPLEQHGSHHH